LVDSLLEGALILQSAFAPSVVSELGTWPRGSCAGANARPLADRLL